MLTTETLLRAVLLLQMMMVLFDILVSHRRMSRWHEKRIQAHLKDQQATQQAKQELQQRLQSNGQASTSQATAEQAASGQGTKGQPAVTQLPSDRAAGSGEDPHTAAYSAPSGTLANGNVSIMKGCVCVQKHAHMHSVVMLHGHMMGQMCSCPRAYLPFASWYIPVCNPQLLDDKNWSP